MASMIECAVCATRFPLAPERRGGRLPLFCGAECRAQAAVQRSAVWREAQKAERNAAIIAAHDGRVAEFRGRFGVS